MEIVDIRRPRACPEWRCGDLMTLPIPHSVLVVVIILATNLVQGMPYSI